MMAYLVGTPAVGQFSVSTLPGGVQEDVVSEEQRETGERFDLRWKSSSAVQGDHNTTGGPLSSERGRGLDGD